MVLFKLRKMTRAGLEGDLAETVHLLKRTLELKYPKTVLPQPTSSCE